MKEYSKHKMEHIMSRILEIRYTDIEEEKRLCLELKDWSIANEDTYGNVFALIYLGDYHIARNEEAEAGVYLLEAEAIIRVLDGYDEVALRLYSLLGIYHDMGADEQNSIECYLKAISLAKKLGDVLGECIILSNLAVAFRRRDCYEEAKRYYITAYERQKLEKVVPFRSRLLSDLAEICLHLNQIEEAKGYIEECIETEDDPKQKQIREYRNWCGYYSAILDRDKAVEYAQLLLANQESVNEDRLAAAEIYIALCRNMMELKEGNIAKQFIEALDGISINCGVDQMKELEEIRIHYIVEFEPASEHPKAYRRFYKENQKFRERINKTIASAIKSKIYLDELMEQAEELESEHKELEIEANIDELTNIYNRRFLETMMREQADSISHESVGVIIIDVDYFKEYNDFYGHVAGDVVLKSIANSLEKDSHTEIFPCRYGGDEFVCICKGLTEIEMNAYIEQILNNVHECNIQHEKSPCSDRVTLSMGYVLEEATQMELYVLFQLADQALYESKGSGRNRYKRKRVSTS